MALSLNRRVAHQEIESAEAEANGHLVHGLRRILPTFAGDYLSLSGHHSIGALFFATHADMNYVVGMGIHQESRDVVIQQCNTIEDFYLKYQSHFSIEVTSYASRIDTISARNVEHQGFQLIYTKLTMSHRLSEKLPVEPFG